MAGFVSNRKCFAIFSTLVLTTTLLVIVQSPRFLFRGNAVEDYPADDYNASGHWRQLSKSQEEKLSVLGRMLFLDEKPAEVFKPENGTYQILVWKYGPTIENRHLKHFSNKIYSPFTYCSVRNCEITYKSKDLQRADLVIFHLHRMQGTRDLPTGERNPKQFWAFLTDESPFHTFLNQKHMLESFNGIFNWSMTYRMDSDIPVPYGRTVIRPKPVYSFDHPWERKRRDVLVTILGSNCGSRNNRWEYVKELQKHIQVDVYGKCGNLSCPGHFQSDCSTISRYMFYLAFENSNCDEYVTEKLWWNAYAKGSIPVVMGAPKDSYKRLLPPDSYIDVNDFARPVDLADYLVYLNETNEFERFYRWRSYFRVLNEHGYFQTESFHYCRACEALNYNSRETKVYSSITDFWSVAKNCKPPWNAEWYV